MSKPLRVVKPMSIVDGMVVTNVAETDHPAWNGATAYTAGQRVIRTTTHRIYERIVNGTTATAPESDAANWLDVGATNAWRMFDATVSSQTVGTGPIVVTISASSVFNAVGLLNVDATSIRIRVLDPADVEVYDKTFPMVAGLSSASYWSWFFEEVTMKNKLVADDLPTYGRLSKIEVTIDNGPHPAKCGVCLVGAQRQIGNMGILSSPRVGITDYSRKEKNDFGELQIVERSWSDRSSFSMLIPNRQLDAIKTTFIGLRAVPALWIASETFESLVIYGIYKDFDAVIAYPEFSECNLEIEGLI